VVTRRYRRARSVLVHRAWRAVQEAGVITADTPAAQKFASFGPGSMFAFPAGSVYGERWIMVGEGTLIGKHVTMCAGMVPGQDLGVPPVLRIGDRCVIGWGSHVVAHHSIDIGDDVFTGPYVYITDQNHGYGDPEIPIGRQMPRNTAVSIGAGTWLGAGALGGARGRPGPVRGGRRAGPGDPGVRGRRWLVAAAADLRRALKPGRLRCPAPARPWPSRTAPLPAG
jgi:hypothetical protein